MATPKAKTKKVLCPECETEVEITTDDDGDYEGTCPNDECKLNVGRILTKRRYDAAVKKMDQAEADAADPKNKNKNKKPFGWQ